MIPMPRPWACAALKSSFNDFADFRRRTRSSCSALKKYGMIMADNGSSMYLSGAPDDRWDNNDLHNLSSLHASDFEVIQMNPVYTASNVPQGSAPAITSFTANPTIVKSGTQVTLSWQTSGASYNIVSPQLGAVRGTSATVTPTQTTTYTLYATSQYGRTQATVTVTVQ